MFWGVFCGCLIILKCYEIVLDPGAVCPFFKGAWGMQNNLPGNRQEAFPGRLSGKERGRRHPDHKEDRNAMVIWREHKANSVGFRNAVYEAVIAGKNTTIRAK